MRQLAMQFLEPGLGATIQGVQVDHHQVGGHLLRLEQGLRNLTVGARQFDPWNGLDETEQVFPLDWIYLDYRDADFYPN